MHYHLVTEILVAFTLTTSWLGVHVNCLCTTASILDCLATIVNFTHPIIQLPLGDATRLTQLCTTDHEEFTACYADLVTDCDPDLLVNPAAVNSAIEHICTPAARTVLEVDGECMSTVLSGERIQSCNIAVYEHIIETISETLIPPSCSEIVDFLTCIRWITWSFCGADASLLLHDVNKLALDGVLSSIVCNLPGDNEPAGLALSYTLSGIYFGRFGFTDPQPTLFRIVGEPSDWLPEHLESETGGDRMKITASSSQVVFGYLAADYWHNKLLWVDTGLGTLNQIPLHFTGSVGSQVIFGALSNKVTGIAVDWVAQNVYVTDSDYKWIGQISYKPGFVGQHKIVIDIDIDKPGGIVTHPRIGRIFWSDTDRGTIESATTVGRDRTIIKSSVDTPTALCIDYPEERLYWIANQGRKVTSCDMTGQDCRDVIIRNTNTRQMLDIDVYEEYLFLVIDREDMIIYDKTSGTQLGKFEYHRFNRQTILSSDGVSVSAPDKQYPYDNPCYFNNGGCTQLCLQDLTAPDGRTCDCSLGYTIMADGITCGTEPFVDEFLLIADRHGHDIYMLDINTAEVQAVPIGADRVPSAIAYDHARRSVLWVDTSSAMYKIFRTSLNGSSNEEISNFDQDEVSELTYDYHTEYVYCTKRRRGQVVRVYVGDGTRTTTVIATSTQPIDIALDAGTQTMYWTDLGFRSVGPKIYKANMDNGSGKHAIVSTGLSYPTGLELDARARKLYFCDMYASTVTMMNLDGTGREDIVNAPSGSFWSIALDQNYLYIADVDDRNVRRYDPVTGAITNFGPPEFQYAVSIRLYHSVIEEYVYTTTTTTTAVPTTTTTSTTSEPTTTTTSTTTTPQTTTTTTTTATTTSTTPSPTSTTTTERETTTTPEATTYQATTEEVQDTTQQLMTSVKTDEMSTQEVTTSVLLPATTTLASVSTTTTRLATTLSTSTTTTTAHPAAATTTTMTTTTTPRATPRETPIATRRSTTAKPISTTTVRQTTTTTKNPIISVRPPPLLTVPSSPATTSADAPSHSPTAEAALGAGYQGSGKSGMHPGFIAAIVILTVLVVVAVAGFFWYNRNFGTVRIFRSVAAKFSVADDTVVLTRDETPMPTSTEPGPSSRDDYDIWMWSAGATEC